MFALGVSIFTIFSKGERDNELLAFCLQILTDVVIFFSFAFRMYAENSNNFTSAQRLYKYS